MAAATGPKPDFRNLIKVLRRQVPDRPTLFEFFLNDALNARLAGPMDRAPADPLHGTRVGLRAYVHAGYDYLTVHACDFCFPTKPHGQEASRSMDEGALISDRASFEAYPWPDPAAFDYSRLDVLGAEIPAGMKLITYGPCGVLENVMSLVGYEHLSYMMADDPALAQEVFDAVGSRLLRYYEICAPHPAVGALISNDDWGFATQTMLAPVDMRRYVFPWHRRIVQTIHAQGKPAILHSCGQLASIMDDIIDDLGFDAKHSYEDKICPVEEAYERWGRRIAILGGIDLDFVCRCTPAQITARSKAMLDRAATRGGYALGTGNSVPHYVPHENYLAMIAAADKHPKLWN